MLYFVLEGTSRRRTKCDDGANLSVIIIQAYLHESRHVHATKRVRGAGGRFLPSAKEKDDGVQKSEDESNQLGSIDKEEMG